MINSFAVFSSTWHFLRERNRHAVFLRTKVLLCYAAIQDLITTRSCRRKSLVFVKAC